MKNVVISALVCALLAGCQTTVEEAVPQSPVDPAAKARAFAEVLEISKPAAMAHLIADQCRSLRLNRELHKQLEQVVQAKLAAGGYSGREAIKQLKSKELQHETQDYALDWVKARKVLVTDRESFCAAGQAEIAEGTAIGKYLLS